MLIGAGWTFLGSGAVCGFAARQLDQRLQNFRQVHHPPSAYRWMPHRLKADLYHWSVARLVRQTWWCLTATGTLVTLGLMLLLLGAL